MAGHAALKPQRSDKNARSAPERIDLQNAALQDAERTTAACHSKGNSRLWL